MLHAVGPVASESASVSACEEIERLLGADRVDHRVDGGGIAEVAPGGEAREEQVPAHEVDEHRHVGRIEAHAGRHRSASTTPLSVWSPGPPLPRSCSSAPTSRRSGRRTRRTSSAAARDRLEEVTIDRVAVERVALREAPHHVPLGEELHEQPVLVEQLELRDRGVTAAEQRDERLARVVRPRLGARSPRSASKRRSVGRAIGTPR